MLIKKFVVEDVTMVGHVESDLLKITIDQSFQKLFLWGGSTERGILPEYFGKVYCCM